ncbi:hypothetical protein [Clostridium sp. UBA6640]|uniref:hypothetical protein n=1 Tax=Clostridium sp. UBA6640 TaxID=1946370 RepID=UPI0025C633A7|nr:hypothetical protein [Clostridium sp. UBA6640]
MSTQHGPITVKPISEVAKYIKTLIPANISETYALKPMFESVASEENIRNGVIAFRDFLYLFCDRLISDGHLYAKPPKKPSSMADYPFLHNITNILVEVGYHSKLAESGDSLLVTEMPSCTALIDANGKKKRPKIPVSSQIECFRFLTLCGFVFTGIDLEAKRLNISEGQLLEVSYPNAPILLAGLKALSIADMELRTGRRYWNDNNLLRCDYRLMKAEDTDILDVLKDFLHPLPEKIQEFALKLHQRYVDVGMTCTMNILGNVNFSYAHISKSRKALSTRDIYQQRVWEFSNSIKNGYCLFVRAKKTDKYADVIEKFPLSLQEKIAKGYGCDRKRNERCQGGCQGIRIPLDTSILNISRYIETWLDNELPSSLRK